MTYKLFGGTLCLTQSVSHWLLTEQAIRPTCGLMLV